MIVWPDARLTREEGQRALEAFRESAAACELETDAHAWHVVAWPWTMARPLRIVLENEAHDALDFTMDDDGIWMLTREPRVFIVRSEIALREDAESEFSPSSAAHMA
jgi:hypothetical protein